MTNELHYFRPDWIEPTDERLSVDVCIYGASSAGVIAAIEARRQGLTVVLLQPGKHIGGLTSGGLGFTDYGRKQVVGGLSREFYRRVGRMYGKDEEFQFDPSIASAVYEAMLREHDVTPRLCEYIASARVSDHRITEITMLSGLHVNARVFIDASYEGDLMAKAGVTYTTGRESNDTYNETLNGIQVRDKHQFSHFVDPYVREGDSSSGLLPGILGNDLRQHQGKSDRRIQAYNFRMCMTDDPSLKIDWQQPDGYDPRMYVLAGRWLRGQKDRYNDLLPGDGIDSSVPMKFDMLPNRTPNGFWKTDTNNHGAFSSDFIGANHRWPEASFEERERIFQAHVTYQKGFYWYVANSDDVPDRYRTAFRRWGLPKDEFTDTGNWPHQLYIREARRLVGAYVVTEHDCRGTRTAHDSIAMGSYGMDSHNCTRFVAMDGGRARVLNEGDVQVGAIAYPISYRAITPAIEECHNLLVPVCLSSSHIAYGSARMEPVFMALGQSAAIAAAHSITNGCAVQEIPYDRLEQELRDNDQVLEMAEVGDVVAAK